jgi:hypothetical protein
VSRLKTALITGRRQKTLPCTSFIDPARVGSSVCRWWARAM